MDSDEHHFGWLRYCAPEFCVDGNKIEVLDTPTNFHKKLITEAKHARERIVLAALYLGTGKLEKELINAVVETAKGTKNGIKIDILVDYVRGSRGEENSKTMLSPLQKQCQGSENLHIALYHTPKLQGFLKNFLPSRWNEVVGIAHLKVFIFDDTLIISGANLSHDYFDNRQDRYMVFHDCPELANHFHSLVNKVSRFSFVLLPDQSTEMNPGWEHHPYNGNFEEFKLEAHSIIRDLVQVPQSTAEHSNPGRPSHIKADHTGFFRNVYKSSIAIFKYCSIFIWSMLGVKSEYETKTSSKRIDSNFTEETQNVKATSSSQAKKPKNKQCDTWVYPTVQMGLFGIRQDEVITENLFRSFPVGSNITLTTGYFNVTDNYCDLLVNSAANYRILLASPEANGFLGSKGFSGYIPSVYIYLCRKFHDKVVKSSRNRNITLWEYIRTGWTFHGKGMWCYLPDETLPSMTMVGSSNFGLRSVNRDLEAQVVVVTQNEKLRRQLQKEQSRMMRHSRLITKETFQQQRCKVPKWVAFVTFFIKRYF